MGEGIFIFLNEEKRPLLAYLDRRLERVFLIRICLLSVVVSVIAILNLSHFRPLLQNHWANFNQTWRAKHCIRRLCSNEGRRPFQRGGITLCIRFNSRNLKSSLLTLVHPSSFMMDRKDLQPNSAYWKPALHT